MSTAEKRRYTVEEYLEFERASELKHEFYRGEIFAMTGASRAHNIITGNVITALNNLLRDKDCEVYASDQRVKVTRTGLYTYPDVSVACDNPRFEKSVLETLLNPKLIVEVLSESTEAYDRGDKFTQYRSIESLQEYMLVSQHHYQVEVYTRKETGRWELSEAQGLDSSVELNALGCMLPLKDVYVRVDLTEAPESQTNG